MTEVLKWAGLIAAGWFLLSVLVAIGWHAVISDGKRIPQPVNPLHVVPDSEEREA
jgi:hypothetical protein